MANEPAFREEKGYTVTEAIIRLPGGLNMRNSMCLVDKCTQYPKGISFTNKDLPIDASSERDGKSIMQTMGLGGAKGAILEIKVEGTDSAAREMSERLYEGITSGITLAEFFFPNDPAYRSSLPYE